KERSGRPAPRRNDGIDADARDVCRKNGRPAHGTVRICGGEDVPPRAARAAELEQWAGDRRQERQERDVREEVPEALRRRADLVDHALTVTRAWGNPWFPPGLPPAAVSRRRVCAH